MKFSEEDEFNPYYCPRCSRQIPRGLSDTQLYCDSCMAQLEEEALRREEAQRQREQLEEQRQQEEEQRRYNMDTGHGACPQCTSRNISQFATGGTDGTAQAGTCCVGCLFFWPLMLLAPFLFRRSKQLHARCNYCGHAWQI